jgi:hypothetical protein
MIKDAIANLLLDIENGTLNRFRRFDFAEIPAHGTKEIPIEAFLTLASFITPYTRCPR